MVHRVNHPRMKGVYDYGHFMAFGLDLKKRFVRSLPTRASSTSKTPSARRQITASCSRETAEWTIQCS